MDDKTFGERIRELREEKDLSLRELSQRLGGLSPAHLCDIELGRRHPSEKVLAKMASVLGASVDELRRYDTRAPVQELKRLALKDPAFGLALRRVVDQEVSSEDLLKLARNKPSRTKK